MNHDETLDADYVAAALALHRLPLDEAGQAAVLACFRRNHAVAAPLLAFVLADEIDPAPVFRA